MLIKTFTEAVWPCIGTTVDYLVKKRSEPISQAVKSGLNFSILLGSACYLEGVFETLLRALLRCRQNDIQRIKIEAPESRRAIYGFYERLEDDLSDRVGHSVGAAAYAEMFRLLAGQSLMGLKEVVPLWEGVTVLFNFRNVLGHGRQVSARHFVGGAVPGGFREDFSGSYRVVEDYLRKKKLLAHRFVDAHSEYVFLSDRIADHFWALANDLPAAIVSSLPHGEQEACRKALQGAMENTEVKNS